MLITTNYCKRVPNSRQGENEIFTCTIQAETGTHDDPAKVADSLFSQARAAVARQITHPAQVTATPAAVPVQVQSSTRLNALAAKIPGAEAATPAAATPAPAQQERPRVSDPDAPATESQLYTINKMRVERNLDAYDQETLATAFTKGTASDYITKLAKTPRVNSTAGQVTPLPASKKQVKMVFALAAQLFAGSTGDYKEYVKAEVNSRFQTTDPTKLTTSQISQLIDYLKEQVNAAWAQTSATQ